MQTISLHGTDLRVSQMCMGTANFGTILDQQQVNAHLDCFLEAGGNFLDTAHVYSDWIPGEKSRSERMIGRWLQTHRRKDVILCTKGGHYDFSAPKVSRVTPEQLCIDLKESLECLQTDYIDLYMLHRDNPGLPVSDIMDCLDGFVRDGRVRYLACSNWSAKRIAQANEYAASHGRAPFAAAELLWSLAEPNREALPSDYVVMGDEMLRLGMESKLSFMCFSALAGGYFTRRYAGRPIPDDLRRTYDNEANERRFDQLRKLKNTAEVTHASLRYFAHQPVTAIPIVAFSSVNQLLECTHAFI